MRFFNTGKLKNRKILISALIILFFISRVGFINYGPVFFDSPEYLTRFANQNYLAALVSGHLPFHAGYILIFWPIYKLAQITQAEPGLFLVIGQIILSSIGIFCFYKFLKLIFGEKTALMSCIIVSLLPLFWITNVTIMMEATYVSFFFISIYFLTKYISLKKRKTIYLVFSIIFFGISFLTHTVVILWLPFIFYLTFYLNRKLLLKIIFAFLAGLVMASLVNGYFISVANRINLIEGTIVVYTSKLNESAQINLSINSILVYLRNFLIPLLRNYTTVVVIIAFISILRLYKFDKKLLFFCIFWIIPSVITNQWWDSLLFGRHSLISGFGLAFLTSLIISRSKIKSSAIVIYLLVVSVPALALLKEEVPYQQVAKVAQKLPKDGLLIETHFARPQVDGRYLGKTVFVDEPGWKKEELEQDIKTAIAQKRPVFITSQALSEPYGLYSGPYLHNLSLSYKKEFILKPIIEKFPSEEYKVISRKNNLIFYKIISTKPSIYPKILSMKFHRRRLDFFDPISQLWFIIVKQFERFEVNRK